MNEINQKANSWFLFNRQAYSTYHEFLKNESNNESLVFKWIPTVDGEFPNGIIMNMSIKLPYFTPLYYRFDINPSE